MGEQLQLDFTKSTTQRARQAERNRDQLTLFAAWAPNIDIALHSPREAIAHIAGKDTDQGADWLRGLIPGARALKRRRIAFPIHALHKLAWTRPPARITLDAASQAIANAQHAHALGYKPLRIHKLGRRVAASSPRGWPLGLRVTDAPWNAVEALLNSDLPLTIAPDAEEAVTKRLERAGTEVATATLSGNSILLTTSRPSLLEQRNLPALAYVGEAGDGTYRMPLLLGDAVLKDKTIKVDEKAAEAIKRATKPAKPLVIDDPDFPYQLWDFQSVDASEGIKALKATGGVLFAGSMGSGKAVLTRTFVATPGGMRQMGDLEVGDYVLAPDGAPTRVLGVYPKEDWPLYRVTFSDGTSVLAGKEHRWRVRTPSQKFTGHPGQVRTTGELLAAGLKEKSGNRRFYIPMTEPLQFEPRDLPVPPYTLGALLGDGSLGQVDLVLSDNDGDVKDQILAELKGTPFAGTRALPIRRNGKVHAWRFSGAADLHGALEELGLWGHRAWDKFVPEQYLYSSVADRLALLQGLLDTDGSCFGQKADLGNHKAHSGHIEYTSTSEALCDAVVWLVQSLGGTASKRGPRRTSYTYQGKKKLGRPSWRVRVSLPSTIEPFRVAIKADRYTPRTKYQPSRGIESIEYWGKDDAVCIEVEHPSHQYVIEHGIVTHNTTVSLGVMHDMDLFPALCVGPASAASTWQRQLSEMGKTFYMATGNAKKDWAAIAEGEYEAYFVTYDRLETFGDLLATKGLKVIVADELQKAKNAGSRRSRALRKLAAAAPYRVGLSGTPLVGGLSDLLAQFAFLAPAEFPPRANSKTLEDRYPGDPVEALTDHIHSMMVRRRMDQVGKKLATREDHKVYVNLTPDQQAAIRALEEEAKAAKEAGDLDGPDGRMNALVLLGKIRGIINNPKAAGVPGPNPKLDATLKIIREAKKDGVRPVVFMQDRKSFDDMGALLDGDDIKWGGINGSTPTEERIEVEQRLHRKEIDAVLCSFAAAEAWSASPTSTMCIIVSPTYSAAVNEQAESRVFRLNSKVEDTVRIIYLHAKNPSGEPSSDDRLFEILQMKKELFAKVIDRIEFEDATDVSNSMSDLLFILTGEKDEKLAAAEADQQRAGDEARRRKEHAKATLYKNKGRNKTDPNVVRDDGSSTRTK